MAEEKKFVQSQPDLPRMGNEVHPLLGSGYEQGFKAGQKQGGAEVLAACIAGLRNAFQQTGESNNSQFVTEDELIQILRSIQPAASDLEALLREEREKMFEGHQPRPMFDGGCYLACSCGWAHGDDLEDGESGTPEDWIRHLEKARASKGKG